MESKSKEIVKPKEQTYEEQRKRLHLLLSDKGADLMESLNGDGVLQSLIETKKCRA